MTAFISTSKLARIASLLLFLSGTFAFASTVSTTVTCSALGVILDTYTAPVSSAACVEPYSNAFGSQSSSINGNSIAFATSVKASASTQTNAGGVLNDSASTSNSTDSIFTVAGSGPGYVNVSAAFIYGGFGGSAATYALYENNQRIFYTKCVPAQNGSGQACPFSGAGNSLVEPITLGGSFEIIASDTATADTTYLPGGLGGTISSGNSLTVNLTFVGADGVTPALVVTPEPTGATLAIAGLVSVLVGVKKRRGSKSVANT